MANLRDSFLYDADGNAIGSYRGALSVHDADVHREIISFQLHQHTATTTTFSIAASAGDININLTSAAGFAIGDSLHLFNGTNVEHPHPQITGLAGTVATLDRPLDHDFSIGDEITKSLVNMKVNGSLASPQIFKVEPLASQIMHITEMSIELTHTSSGDNGLFGDLAKLTNGVVLRRYDGTTGTHSTYTVWKDNGDIYLDTSDIYYASRSGSGATHSTNSSGNLKDIAKAVLYLDGSVGDYFEVLVQDNLTSLVTFRIKVHGHYEGA